MITFNVTKEDARLIMDIVNRVRDLAIAPGIDYLGLEMDVTACHANGCPLKLAELLGAKEFDFLHDIGGIHRHINRETGKLENCFLPRFAA